MQLASEVTSESRRRTRFGKERERERQREKGSPLGGFDKTDNKARFTVDTRRRTVAFGIELGVNDGRNLAISRVSRTLAKLRPRTPLNRSSLRERERGAVAAGSGPCRRANYNISS